MCDCCKDQAEKRNHEGRLFVESIEEPYRDEVLRGIVEVIIENDPWILREYLTITLRKPKEDD